MATAVSQVLLKANPAQAGVKLLELEDLPVYVKMLVYGEPGKGKTFLAATAPKPIILLTEVEVSKPTLKLVQHQLNVNPKIVIINTLASMDAALDFLEAGGHNYETVVLDSLTDLNRFITQEMVKQGVVRRSQHDPDVPEMGDWYRIEERTRSYLRRLRDLPMHLVVNCLLADVREESMVAPMLQPKRLMYEVASYFNAVGQLVVHDTGGPKGEVRRELHVEASQSRIAKNPGNALDAVIKDLNLTNVFAQVTSALANSAEISALAK
jgi:hypothetical protein